MINQNLRIFNSDLYTNRVGICRRCRDYSSLPLFTGDILQYPQQMSETAESIVLNPTQLFVGISKTPTPQNEDIQVQKGIFEYNLCTSFHLL